jgi:sterol desaturase/sphingolipid hydroxylase (fatty acid hydroxylase superfamily)
MDMPSPLELLLDPLTLSVIAIFSGLALWEAVFPARRLPRVRLWRTRGVLAFGCYMAISSYLPFLWAEWLAPLQLFDLSGLSTLAGAVIGVLAYEAGVWIWHRGLHGSGTLWRYLHQWHHSAERLDTWGAFWFSPLDMVGWTALFSLALTLVGLSPSAVFATVCFTTFLSVFQHANVHTPRWLGVLVQRPESHSWHHARGVHAGNYSDLPLFDILLGTWKNPRDFAPQQGFHHGASSEFAGLLLGRDVASMADAGASAPSRIDTIGEAS